MADKAIIRAGLDEARAILLEQARTTASEEMDAEQALARVSAEPVFARFASPAYRVSAMDGIALRARDTAEAAAGSPLVFLEASPTQGGAEQRDIFACWPIDTGGVVPEAADAVVRIEDTRRIKHGYEICRPVAPGADIRAVGEDIDAGDLLFGRGHQIRPYDIGALLATGVSRLAVLRKPRVAMLATGSEVVEPGQKPEPGKVIEFNSRVLGAFVEQWGGEASYLGRVADDRTLLCEALRRAAASHDIVCVIAGSSVGRRDFTTEVLSACGRLLVRGVRIMPGRPVALALLDQTPTIAVPGYPVSAVVVYRELLEPLLAACLCRSCEQPATIKAQVRRKITSKPGVEEFLRVCLARDGDDLVVAPLKRGAASIVTLVRAHGILRIAESKEGVDAGALVEVELLRSPEELLHAVVVATAPDRLTAGLEQLAHERDPRVHFAHLGLAAHDALAAMAAGQAHVAVLEAGERRAIVGERLDRNLGSWRGYLGRRIRSGPPALVVITETFAQCDSGKVFEQVLECKGFERV